MAFNNTEKREYKPAEPRVVVNLGKIELAIESLAESIDKINRSLARLAVIKTCEHIENVGGHQCQRCAVKPLEVSRK